MSLKFTILIPKLTESPSFVVDTAAVGGVVSVTQPGNVTFDFYNTAGDKLFRAGDSFTILSYGIILPENFQFNLGSTAQSKNGLCFYIGSSVGPLKEFGDSDGYVFCPVENYEIACNTFVDSVANGLTSGNFSLKGDIGPAFGQTPKISMVGTPAALNGTTQYIRPFVKVAHTKNMTPT